MTMIIKQSTTTSQQRLNERETEGEAHLEIEVEMLQLQMQLWLIRLMFEDLSRVGVLVARIALVGWIVGSHQLVHAPMLGIYIVLD